VLSEVGDEHVQKSNKQTNERVRNQWKGRDMAQIAINKQTTNKQQTNNKQTTTKQPMDVDLPASK
jgi:hypothetical protein